MTELFAAQIMEPFRIALALGLVLTMLRTQGQTGTWLPLALGVLFIAVIIPVGFGAGPAGFAMTVGVGLLSTALIVAVILAVRALVLKAMGR